MIRTILLLALMTLAGCGGPRHWADASYSGNPHRVLVSDTGDPLASMRSEHTFDAEIARNFGRCGVAVHVMGWPHLTLNPHTELLKVARAFKPDAQLLVRQSSTRATNYGALFDAFYTVEFRDLRLNRNVWWKVYDFFGRSRSEAERRGVSTGLAGMIVSDLARNHILRGCPPSS